MSRVIDAKYETALQFISGSVGVPRADMLIEVLGYSEAGVGAGVWRYTGASGQSPSQSPLDLSLAKLTDANGYRWELVYGYKIDLDKLGFINATAQQRTDLVQGLSDNLTNVELSTPVGEYTFAASSLTETWPDNDAGTISASSCAVVMRQDITYSGAGRDATSWEVPDPAVSIAFIDNGTNTTIKDMEFKSTYTGVESGAGHALFNLVKALDDTVTNLNITNIRCKNIASYGIGLNYGYQTNCLINDVETDVTGGDGIDIKSRATSNLINNSNTYSHIRCNNFGLRLDGQVGLDVRGECTIHDCWFTGYGDGTKTFTGLRLRPASEVNNLSINTTVTNIHCIAGNSANTYGIQMSGDSNSIIGFSVSGCDIGVSIQESTKCNVYGGVISGHNTYAVDATVSAEDCNMSSVFAHSAGTATDHFRIEGEGLSANSVSGDTTANVWSLSTGANNTISRDSPKTREYDGLDIYEIVSGRVGVAAKGASADIDIALGPKGTGKLRFGTHETVAAETVTGFIKIKDSSGVERKLAILS